MTNRQERREELLGACPPGPGRFFAHPESTRLGPQPEGVFESALLTGLFFRNTALLVLLRATFSNVTLHRGRLLVTAVLAILLTAFGFLTSRGLLPRYGH